MCGVDRFLRFYYLLATRPGFARMQNANDTKVFLYYVKHIICIQTFLLIHTIY
jgi:hypothetical protein